jgi:hypothetical protein
MKSRRVDMKEEPWNTHKEINAYKILFAKEGNINIDREGREYEDLDWIKLTWKRIIWLDDVNMIMIL